MGSNISCDDPTLNKGWTATVEEVIEKAKLQFVEWGTWTLQQLKEFALHFARVVDIRQDGTLWDMARQLAREMGVNALARSGHFIAFCQFVLKQFVKRVLLHPAVISIIKKGIDNCIAYFLSNCPVIHSACNEAFISMLKKAQEALARYSAGTGLKEAATNTLATAGKSAGEKASKRAIATASAKSAFASAAVVDTALFGVSTGYSYYQYKNGNITWEEHKEHVTKRAVATGGSIAGTTAGAFVGSLIFPGVGTFVGGVIGGMAGDFFGSKTGEAMYEKLSHNDADHSHVE